MVEFYAATEGNVALVNVMGERGACGYFPPLLSFVYPFLLVKEGESGEVYRDESGRCVVVKKSKGIGMTGGERGLLLSPIQASRVYEGYTDKKDTEKKIISNVRREGDMYFNSGDILVTDARGFYYFADRGGESFRYRGENVSTTEVSVCFTGLVADVCVYGVGLPHGDGKGGMACLTPLSGGVDMEKVGERVCSSLPSYARPLFVRVKRGLGMGDGGGDRGDGGLPVTSTFKHLKG
ncbi:long-chain-acyl-CoA synthetase, partial [archaeon]